MNPHREKVQRALVATAHMLDRFEPLMMPGPLAAANDNPRRRRYMTGDFEKDCRTLQQKWAVDDIAMMSWVRSFAGISLAAAHAVQEPARQLMALRRLPADAVITALCMSLVNALFAYIKQLPNSEAVFVLDEIARQSNSLIEPNTKGREL